MQSLHLFLVIIIFAFEFPSKSDTRSFPRIVKNSRPYLNFRDSTLQMRERNELKQKYDNTNFRKHGGNNIPIIIITRTNPHNKKINKQTDQDLFGAENIIYVKDSNMARENRGLKDYDLKIGRRSDDLKKKYRRKLMAIMNKELNRQLLAKANQASIF